MSGLEQQRAADRVAAVEDVIDLAMYVKGRLATDDLDDVPAQPGNRVWMVLRIARGHASVFDAMLGGEFKSVAEAYRAAGFARAKRRVDITRDPKAWAEKLVAMLDDKELEAAAAVLNEVVRSRADERQTMRDQDEMNARQNRERRIREASRRRQVRGR